MELYINNSLSRKKEIFKPLKDKKIGLFTCGPTVYLYAHLGNLRTYLFEDVLKRVLEYKGYKVQHVMNITDVGHLTSDADTGEDKLEKEAQKEKKSVWEIAKFYTNAFKKDIKRLDIEPPDIWVRATKTIKEQIDLIKILQKKGFTYQIEDGVYFDTSKLKTYGRLWPSKKMKLKPGARVEMVKGKRRPTDFALWKLTPPGVKRQMEWDSPWGRGFPGWHTECVVMAAGELGMPFDIHCGGIDHIAVHHNNEIAQAEAAFGKVLARFWLHGEFLVLKQGRMGKSEGNIIILDELIKKGFNPLAFRYLCLTAHYRSKLMFSWESLAGCQNALNKLHEITGELQSNEVRLPLEVGLPKIRKYQEQFLGFINDDLDMPKALALMWKMLDDKNLTDKEKYGLLLDFDKVFGLGLGKIKRQKIPKQVSQLIKQREKLRQQKEWKQADILRQKIKKLGFEIEDTEQGPKTKMEQQRSCSSKL